MNSPMDLGNLKLILKTRLLQVTGETAAKYGWMDVMGGGQATVLVVDLALRLRVQLSRDP